MGTVVGLGGGDVGVGGWRGWGWVGGEVGGWGVERMGMTRLMDREGQN